MCEDGGRLLSVEKPGERARLTGLKQKREAADGRERAGLGGVVIMSGSENVTPI